MAVNEMKKGMTIIMMMLMIIFGVNQVFDATQTIYACQDYCGLCEKNCRDGCFSFRCIKQCKTNKCPCCLHSTPAFAKGL